MDRSAVDFSSDPCRKLYFSAASLLGHLDAQPGTDDLEKFWAWHDEASWYWTYFSMAVEPLKPAIMGASIIRPPLLARLERAGRRRGRER